MSAAAALTAMLAGGATQAVSQYQQGQVQKAALNDQSSMKEFQASAVDAAGKSALSELTYQQGLVAGTQAEAYGAGGVATGGSTLELLQETNRRDALAQATMKFNYDSQAYALRRGAQLDRFYGSQSLRAGTTNAIGTVLTTGAQAYFASQSVKQTTPSLKDTVVPMGEENY